MICHYYDAPTFLFFAADLPELLYYSHISSAIVALLVGLFVFINRPKQPKNQLLFLMSLSFAGWVTLNLVAWTNIDVEVLLFSWTFFGILQALISILAVYFIYAFLNEEHPTLKMKSALTALILPVIILAPTNLNVSGFDLDWCDAFGFEGFAYLAYYSSLGVVAMLWIAVMLFQKYRKVAERAVRKQILLIGIGIELFLLMFYSITFLASYLANIGLVNDSDLEFYGLFGMVIFMVLIGVLIVRYKSFNIGMIASQALVIALVLLVAAQFTYASTPTTFVLKLITLVMTLVFGLVLIRSVKNEISQRNKIEILAGDLEKANTRLKALDKQKSEFVSIASHQLRSPIASIRGYASLLLEGSYGKLPKKSEEPLARIEQSSKLMALAIEDYLNVSRIEAGNMKYNLADFNLKDQVEHVCDDLRPQAMKEHLVLLFRSKITSTGIVHADLGKTVQIIQNLITNSIKYTEKGSITVLVRDDLKKKRIYVDVIDTGIGMNKQTLHTIFQKFERADNANEFNVHGTGLGLFVAMKMAEAMKGDITAHSEGDKKGSRFTFELPLEL